MAVLPLSSLPGQRPGRKDLQSKCLDCGFAEQMQDLNQQEKKPEAGDADAVASRPVVESPIPFGATKPLADSENFDKILLFDSTQPYDIAGAELSARVSGDQVTPFIDGGGALFSRSGIEASAATLDSVPLPRQTTDASSIQRDAATGLASEFRQVVISPTTVTTAASTPPAPSTSNEQVGHLFLDIHVSR